MSIDVATLQSITPGLQKQKPYAAKKGRFFESSVFKVSIDDDVYAIKYVLVSDDRAKKHIWHEHEVLQKLSFELFVSCAGSAVMGNVYVLATEWVDGIALHENPDIVKNSFSASEQESFANDCESILAALSSRQLRHQGL